MSKKDFVKSLRDFADFVEERNFDFDSRPITSQTFFIFCQNEDEFRENSKLLGSFEKSANDWLNATKSFGEYVKLQVTISRDSICKRVKVGTKIIPAKPELVIPASPEKEEDVFEYQCPESFLNLKKDLEVEHEIA